MALDYGERRIGVAVSDPTGVLAQPLVTVPRRGRGKGHLDRIAELAKEYEVTRFVIGLPLHLDGRHGPEADTARSFGAEIETRTGLAVEFLDERWTSVEAERLMAGSGARRRDKGSVDRVAAAILLRTWLERNRA